MRIIGLDKGISLKHLAFWILLSGLMIAPANATPPDMICRSGDDAAKFDVILITSHSALNSHEIIPLAIHHSKISIGQLFANTKPVIVPLYSEDIKGQWLKNKRVDLHLYHQEKDSSGRLFSIDLTITTRSTGKRDDESGHVIHHGEYELNIYSGAFRQGTGTLVKTTKGKAVCSSTP